MPSFIHSIVNSFPLLLFRFSPGLRPRTAGGTAPPIYTSILLSHKLSPLKADLGWPVVGAHSVVEEGALRPVPHAPGPWGHGHGPWAMVGGYRGAGREGRKTRNPKP